jgi:hypothetical protein
MSFFTGSPAEYEQISNLTPQQLKLEKERRMASKGGFGEVRNYYSNLLSDDSADFNAFAAPEMRRYNEQIIPDLAEQFAGMGSGALSSSGFRNAAVSAGTDLSERLAAIRAGLRQNAASGLQNLAQSSLTPHSQYQMTNPGSEGFLSGVSSGIGSAIPGAISGFLTGGPPGAFAGAGLGFMGGFGKSSPYGTGGQGINGMSSAVRNANSAPYNPL